MKLRIDWSQIISDSDLIILYQTKTLAELDKLLGVSTEAIRNKLQSLGAIMRKKGPRPLTTEVKLMNRTSGLAPNHLPE